MDMEDKVEHKADSNCRSKARGTKRACKHWMLEQHWVLYPTSGGSGGGCGGSASSSCMRTKYNFRLVSSREQTTGCRFIKGNYNNMGPQKNVIRVLISRPCSYALSTLIYPGFGGKKAGAKQGFFLDLASESFQAAITHPNPVGPQLARLKKIRH